MSGLSIAQKLIKKAQSGCHSAFNALVTSCYFRLLNAITLKTKNYDDARDIIQESLLKAYHSIKNFKGKSSFYSWLYRITLNTTKDHWKKLKQQPPIQDVDIYANSAYEQDNNLHDARSPEACLLLSEMDETIQKTIRQLPKELQDTVKLRELGYEYRNIASFLKVPLGTIRSRLNRARAILQTKLATKLV